MKKNVGGADRIFRIVLGVVLIAIALLTPLDPVWRGVLLVLAAIALITGLVRFCPLNALIGLNTTRRH